MDEKSHSKTYRGLSVFKYLPFSIHLAQIQNIDIWSARRILFPSAIISFSMDFYLMEVPLTMMNRASFYNQSLS
jgi:hypothetical protein